MADSNLHVGYGHNSRGDPNASLNQGVALCLLKADCQRSPLAISNSARGMLRFFAAVLSRRCGEATSLCCSGSHLRHAINYERTLAVRRERE
jgi:hypothetical protein